MTHQPSSGTLFISGALKEWLNQTELGSDLAFRVDLEKRIEYYSDQYLKVEKIDSLGVIRSIYDLIDENLTSIDAETQAKIQCKKGCSFCCHYPVTISKAEAHYIGYYCKKNNITISKKYLKKQLRVPEAEIHTTSVSACVFLKNKICAIYSARPLNCRKYLVYSDPKICNSKLGLAKPITYFDYNIEAIISGVFSNSPVGRLPEMLLAYSK